MVQIKRVYETIDPSDGYRVLVDRLWPRGVSKERAQVDTWLKEIAPSPELRTWFSHDPAKFTEFRQRYLHELTNNPAVTQLTALIHEHPTVTLLYGARNTDVNDAVVLQEFLTQRPKAGH